MCDGYQTRPLIQSLRNLFNPQLSTLKILMMSVLLIPFANAQDNELVATDLSNVPSSRMDIVKEIIVVETSSDSFDLSLESHQDVFEGSFSHRSSTSQNGVIEDLKDFVVLGEKVYDLVQKGRPTVSTSFAPISFVPKIDSEPVNPLEMEGFKVPRSKTYKISYVNMLGVEVVNFKFSIIYSYGGSYKGKGKYLAGIYVSSNIQTGYMYDFKATMTVASATNIGTIEDPIAGVTLSLEHQVKTFSKHTNKTQNFFIDGNGNFTKL